MPKLLTHQVVPMGFALCAFACGSSASNTPAGTTGSMTSGTSASGATTGAASSGTSGGGTGMSGMSATAGESGGTAGLSSSGSASGDMGASGNSNPMPDGSATGQTSGGTTGSTDGDAGSSGSGTSGGMPDAGGGTTGSSGGSAGSTGSTTGSGGSTCAGDAGAGALPWPVANKIVCETVVPTFPSKTCTVTDAAYGGAGDGTTDNTTAFQKAIADCSQAGGGHVVVPSGTFMTGAIELLDNIDLHLSSGATIKFNGNVSEYPIVLTRYEGIELMNHSPMVYAYKRTNIAVTGPGVLDASATGSWNTGSDRTPLETYANNNTPVSQRAANGCCRSTFVEPYSSTNVLLQGFTLKGAHFWQIHPTLSTNVTVDSVTVTNSGQLNNDGFDPESSDHIVLTNSTIQANDDAMAIKSGRDTDGRRINVPTSNFVFMHSSFASTVGLMTLGSELTGGIHDVYGYDLKAISPGVAYVFQIKGNTLRGGVVNEVHMDTVSATNGVKTGVINADMHYMNQTGPYTPMYGNFSLSNAKIDGAPWVLHLTGVSAADPLGMVSMENSTYTNIASTTNTVQYATVVWTNVTINGVAAH